MTTELRPVELPPPPAPPAPPTTLVHGVAGTGCASCGTPMASDQRYCVRCGARRGKPRFTPETLATPAAAATVAAPPPGTPRSHAATALIAGIGTLLLAMGVGVLIGHNSSSGPVRAARPQVITVGGPTGAAGSTTGQTASATPAAAKDKHGKKAKTKVVHVTPEVAKKAASAAAKTLGAGAPKDPTVSVGGSCSTGTAGCNNGKFDGNFFGG